jgi:hypothetical protein
MQNLLRLVSTAASARGRAVLFEGGGGGEQAPPLRPASVGAPTPPRPARQQVPSEGKEAGEGEEAEEGSMGEAGDAVPMDTDQQQAGAGEVGGKSRQATPQRGQQPQPPHRMASPPKAEDHAAAARPALKGQDWEQGLGAAAAGAGERGAGGAQGGPPARRSVVKQESFSQSAAGGAEAQHGRPPRPQGRSASPLQSADGGGGGAVHRADTLAWEPTFPPARWAGPSGGSGQPRHPEDEQAWNHTQQRKGARESRHGLHKRVAREAQVEALIAAAAALSHERRDAHMQQARFQRRLSLEVGCQLTTERLGVAAA